MKALLKALLLTPAIALGAEINVEPPTKYTNGDILPSGSISHHEVCAITTSPSCEAFINVSGTFGTDILPTSTTAIKARTVTTTGAVSDWSNIIDEPFKRPLPPTLTIKITVEISTNTGADHENLID